MGFTVHRPPCGEVSLCWYRPSGGDVAGRVHVGVARPRIASDAREDRLALAVFGRDVPAGGASLRRVRGGDPFEAARSLVVEPGNQPTPPLTTNGAIEAPLLRNPNTRLVNRAAGRAGHRAHVERLDSNGVEPVCQIGCGLLDPVAPAVGFARFKSRDGQPGARSAVGAPSRRARHCCSRRSRIRSPRAQARNTHQLSSGQCCRDCHSAINTDHAAVPRAQDRVRDVGEGDMPTPGPIASDAVGLHTRRYGPGPAEADPANFGHPNPSITLVELLNVARLETDLPEAFMHPSFAPRRTPMGAGEETPHGLREVPQRLLLHCLRPGRQPVVLARISVNCVHCSLYQGHEALAAKIAVAPRPGSKQTGHAGNAPTTPPAGQASAATETATYPKRNRRHRHKRASHLSTVLGRLSSPA